MNFWAYLDETGTPDYDPDSLPFFAFGSALFEDDHGVDLMSGLKVRACRKLQKGFHACADSKQTRESFFTVIHDMDAKFFATFLKKHNAYEYVQRKGNLYLYKYALYSHISELVRYVSQFPGDNTLYIVVAHIDMRSKRQAVKEAISDVCDQYSHTIVFDSTKLADYDLTVTPQIWTSESSMGLQIADYALWAIQRSIVSNKHHFYNEFIKEKMGAGISFPWRQ